jgi:formylmethanofuran--tetrahydromethanopterin N-formyltransferase
MVKEGTYREHLCGSLRGIFCRVIVTADDEETLRRAVEDATATPSVVIGRIEGGIEKWLTKKKHLTSAKAPFLQFWGGIDPKKPFKTLLKSLRWSFPIEYAKTFSLSLSLQFLTPCHKSEGKMDMMERVGHCGDGYEWDRKALRPRGYSCAHNGSRLHNRALFRLCPWIHGGKLLDNVQNQKAVKEAGGKALEAIHEVEGVITPFDVCSAGSKPETRFPWIGPTTNHPYCPSLKKRLGERIQSARRC